MSFQLVYGDHEVAVALPFESHIEERLIGLLGSNDSQAPSRLAARIADVITAMLEDNVTPPTERQIKYAVAIAQELSLELPAEVLQHRDAMAAFLAAHANKYRRRKGSNS